VLSSYSTHMCVCPASSSIIGLLGSKELAGMVPPAALKTELIEPAHFKLGPWVAVSVVKAHKKGEF